MHSAASRPRPEEFRVSRTVTRGECPWLQRDILSGTLVRRFDGPTYGCISRSGIACSFTGHEPFFELPRDALASSRPLFLRISDRFRNFFSGTGRQIFSRRRSL